jgi:hypothetical protein
VPFKNPVVARNRGPAMNDVPLHQMRVLALDRNGPAHPQRAVEHIALRPLWLCRACADPWPCATARLLLKAQYDQDQVALSIHMCGVLHEAVRDLYRLNPHEAPAPRAMFDRFVGWTPYRRPIIP